MIVKSTKIKQQNNLLRERGQLWKEKHKVRQQNKAVTRPAEKFNMRILRYLFDKLTNTLRLMLFALCSVLHKVSSVPQGISDKKHNFVLCRAIFYLCGNRFRFLCFVISYKKAQKSRPAIKAFCLYTGRPAMPSPISCSESFI